MGGIWKLVAAGDGDERDSAPDRGDGARADAYGPSAIQLPAVARGLRRDPAGAAAAAADRSDRGAESGERAGDEDDAVDGRLDRLRAVGRRVRAASLHGVRRDADAEAGAGAGDDAGRAVRGAAEARVDVAAGERSCGRRRCGLHSEEHRVYAVTGRSCFYSEAVCFMECFFDKGLHRILNTIPIDLICIIKQPKLHYTFPSALFFTTLIPIDLVELIICETILFSGTDCRFGSVCFTLAIS